jgi:hypothetical protein
VKTRDEGSEHPEGCDCGTLECPSSGGAFYVLAIRGREEFEIAGPFDTAAEALEVMPRAWFYFWKLNPRNRYRWAIGKFRDGRPHPPSLLNGEPDVSIREVRMKARAQ